jgi:hypothetical protein
LTITHIFCFNPLMGYACQICSQEGVGGFFEQKMSYR